MTKMRAKLQVSYVQENVFNGTKYSETLNMYAVPASKYDESGLDEDNTFAKMSPQANLGISIANPALWGQFKVGQRFYVDFTEAE